ncbi:MAG: hypothetical protein LBC51_01190 [Treponema sp.]|jgi:hypothetical protein|nr:hypothetical protein [Treponema sp.]
MKKSVFPRLIGLFFLYMAIFVLLGTLQFAHKGTFTRQIGSLVVSGRYRSSEYGKLPQDANHYPLAGELVISFGGMRFSITDRNDGLSLIKTDGTKEAMLPVAMTISGETLGIQLSGGAELIFGLSDTGERTELLIHAVLGEAILGLELPYKPLKTSRNYDRGDGQFEVVADTGITYGFSRILLDSERHVLVLHQEAPFISYRPVLEGQSFTPQDFILTDAQYAASYKERVSRWREQSFNLWSRSISTGNSEDLVLAYGGEAISRGTYRQAIAAVPAAFLNGTRRTYESTVFLGQLDLGLRSLVSAERDTFNRLSRMIQEGSLEFLKEPHVVEYLAVRGYLSLLKDGLGLLNTLDPARVSPDLIPAMFDGYTDWMVYRSITEKTGIQENPFMRFIDQMYFIISQGLTKSPQGVFVFYEGRADTAFNLHLGKAFMVYAENAGIMDWAAIGRSLILSVLSLVNAGGTAPAGLFIAEEGILSEDTSSPRLSSALLYRILTPGENYPRAVSLSSGNPAIWTWTAASSLSVSQGNAMLDIAVSFPVEEIHYMLIRGIPRPTRVQIYDMDYRTAPDFERYNSSGWSYSASEQTLLLKMRHRNPVEHIRIFY